MYKYLIYTIKTKILLWMAWNKTNLGTARVNLSKL